MKYKKMELKQFNWLFDVLFWLFIINPMARANLVYVSSTYESGYTGVNQFYTVFGSGFWIGYDCKSYTNDIENLGGSKTLFGNADHSNPTYKNSIYNSCAKNFIVTAAHLSQGINPEIEISNLPPDSSPSSSIKLETSGTLSDNWNDVQIFEINPKQILDLKLQPLLRCKDQNSTIICSNEFLIKSNLASFFPNFKSPHLKFDFRRFGQVSYISENKIWKERRFLSLLTSKLKDKSERDHVIHQRHNNYRWALNGERVILSHAIIPGMSGSPLLSTPANSVYETLEYILDGIGIQTDFDFQESFFAGKIVLSKLIQNYLKGDRDPEVGRSDNITPNWFYEEGKSYRKLILNSFQISESKITGHKKNTDGNKIDVHECNEVNCDKESWQYTTDLKIKYLNEEVEKPLLGIRLQSLKPIETTPSSFNIFALLFSSTTENSDLTNGALWADMPTLNQVVKAFNLNSVEELSTHFIIEDPNLNLIELLKSKLSLNKKTEIEPTHYQNFNSCQLSLKNNQSTNDEIITIHLDNKKGNTLDFNLNSQGNLLSAGHDRNKESNSEFRSRIRVDSSKEGQIEKSYLVDIRQLFFTDLHENSIEEFTDEKLLSSIRRIILSDGPKLKIKELNELSPTFSISCKMKQSEE